MALESGFGFGTLTLDSPVGFIGTRMKKGGWQHHTAGVDDPLTGCQLCDSSCFSADAVAARVWPSGVNRLVVWFWGECGHRGRGSDITARHVMCHCVYGSASVVKCPHRITAVSAQIQVHKMI